MVKYGNNACSFKLICVTASLLTGKSSRYSDSLLAGRSGDRIAAEARFSAPVQTGPGAHPASCTMGTGFFRGVKSGRGVTLTPHPLLVLWSRNGRAIPLLSQWAVRPVQSLSACTSVNFTFYFMSLKCFIIPFPNKSRNNNFSVSELRCKRSEISKM